MLASAVFTFDFVGFIYFIFLLFHCFAYYSFRSNLLLLILTAYDETIDIIYNLRNNKRNIRGAFAYSFVAISGFIFLSILIGQIMLFFKWTKSNHQNIQVLQQQTENTYL